MSDVKRYYVSGAGIVEGTALGRINVVLAVDHDRVTAELASANSDKDAYAQNAIDLRKRVDALQALLTAADERNDERDTEIAAQVESALRRSFSLGQIYWQQADSDSTCQQNKSDLTMEVQQQHILNVLKSLSAALSLRRVVR